MRTLETNRLIIRDWRESDYLDLYEYASDCRVGPNAGWDIHKSRQESLAAIRKYIRSNVYYAVVLKSENKVIGGIGIYNRAPDELIKGLNQRELGFVINPKYWGNGYAAEAVKVLMKYGFEEMNLDLIWCGHWDFNVRSKRVIEKCGFKYKFSRPLRSEPFHDMFVNVLFYNIFRNEYYNNHANNQPGVKPSKI